MTTKERFVEYLKFKGMGQTAFEELAGLSRGAIAKKTGFNADSIEKIAIACPDLNINWLVTGIGYVNIPEFTGCYGITVYGDSMYDMYMSGDIIFVREIKDKRHIDNGQPYVIITKEDRLLKMIHIDYEHRKTLLSSYNNATNPDGKRKYPDMEIDIDNDVLYLYKIVGKLARTQM